MAQLVPTISVEEISLKPERDVAQALVEQLPDEVVVYHSYPWLRADRNDRHTVLKEGETDFLILWPELGLLVLEVKGGDIHYDWESRAWWRLTHGRRCDIRDPFEQARRNLHQISDVIKNRVYGGQNPKFSCGYAIFFPDCIYHGEMPPGADSDITLSSLDLAQVKKKQVKKKIDKALRLWTPVDPPYAIEDAELKLVKQAVLPQFHIRSMLSRGLAGQEEKLSRLTDDQIRLLQFLGAHNRVAIEGVAGAGKTMLAKAQAQRFADAGKKTLLLCYNKHLAQWLNDEVSETYAGLIDVYHFQGLCRALCEKAGVPFSPPSVNIDDFWKCDAANLLLQALDSLPEDRYDAVVVDEGIDFYPDWWVPLEVINAEQESGSLYVFYDSAQNLYNDGANSIPDLGATYILPTNCRNTKTISQTCGEILDRDIDTHPEAPYGSKTEVVVAKAQDAIAKIERWVQKWVGVNKVTPSQIAVLSSYRKEDSCLAERTELSKVPVVEDLQAWRAGEGVLFSTIREFKGLEADIVVVVDVVEPGSRPGFSKFDFYVACSRAKHVLKILSTTELADL